MSEMNFLEGYMRLNEGTEVPDAFAMWCGAAAVSATLGRNSYVKFGQENIYPNMFVLIVAGSGTHRKSTAIGRAEKLLRLMSPGPNLIAQKLSPEALIQSIRRIETKDMKNLLKEECTGFVIADELSTFLNRKSYEAGLASLLIQMFDAKDKWTYKTVSRGEETIENACLGMLAGSTVDWIRSGIPEEAVGGGLTSRILFVYVEEPAQPVPFPVWTPQHELLRDQLVRQLQVISTIQGEFQLTQDARNYFSQEYISFYTTGGDEFKNDRTLSGYFSRRHIHMLKLSMVLSAAGSQNKVIQKSHLIAATVMLSDVEKFLKKVLSLITSSNSGSEIQGVARYIQVRRKCSHVELVRNFSSRMNSKHLKEVIDTLLNSGQVELMQDMGGTHYIWKG